MDRSNYSFLDYTVMPFLRKKVISSDAAVLFSSNFSNVLWANAIGTRLFGGSNVIDLLEAGLSQTHPLVRQLTNAARQIEDDEPIVRNFQISRGLKTETIRGEIAPVRLPNGMMAMLLTCPQVDQKHRYREHELASMSVESLDGFADASAIIDEYGLILASSRQFDAFEIDPATLETLVGMVAREDDRLVKRPIEAGNGDTVAAGLGRIRDLPARFLVVLASTREEDADADEEGKIDTPEQTFQSLRADAFETPLQEDYTETEDGEPAGNEAVGDHFVSDMEDGPDDSTADLPPWLSVPDADQGSEFSHGQGEEPFGDEETVDDLADDTSAPEAVSMDTNGEETGGDTGQEPDTDSIEDSINEITDNAPRGSLLDRWYFDPSNQDERHKENKAEGENKAEDLAGTGDDHTTADEDTNMPDGESKEPGITASGSGRTAGDETGGDETGGASLADATPSRFAFTIDGDGVIQSVSPELTEAVGPVSGDIVGKNWETIARARGIDENGAINTLLSKADTWSGKSVLWPIDKTDMAVPIDLAALPVFGKDRNFEGFRGFGIIRIADTMVDPAARGLALALEGNDALSRRDDTVGVSRPEDVQSDVDDDGDIGWRSDLEEEDRPTDLAQGIIDVASEPRETEASRKDEDQSVRAGERGNIFHLPNYRTDKKQRFDERGSQEMDKALFSVPSDFGDNNEDTESDDEKPTSTHSGAPELSGREKRAFGEIRRSLSEEENGLSGTVEDKSEDEDGAETGRNKETLYADHEEGTESGALLGGQNSVLGSLPIPLLVYQASKTLFANEALLTETGYGSVEELDEAGGIEALLANEDGDSGSTIRTSSGELVAVNSRLTKVDWNGESALCLSFERQAGEDQRNPAIAAQGVAGSEKAALDMVRVSELENILETAADGLLIIDGERNIESLNTSGEALFGKSQSEVVGKPFVSLFASESRGALERHMDDLQEMGETRFSNHGQEVIGIEANGGFIPLFAMIGKVGSSGRLCAVLRDLTNWKKTEEELVEAKRKAETANDQKSEFLSRVSHEIREPLTSIIGFSDVMIEERFGKIENERYREYLKDINRSGIHVLDLVNDLLDISKIEAGKLELSYEAVDLNQLASETVALLQPKANNKRIIIRTSLSRAVPKVVADARSIRQIILNLVSNAIQHSHRNSQVIVSTTYEETGEVALRIRDTGSGMSEAELKRALEPFAQVGEDRMESPGGTGLGLPLTKALVEANRAYFELESEKGDGTIAHIQFPSQRVLAD